MSKDKTLKTRLKIATRTNYDTYSVETTVEGQIKIGMFYKTVVSLQVTYGRTVEETKAVVESRLKQFVDAGFNSEGVIDL